MNPNSILNTLDRDLILSANAGSGKTYALVEYYFNLLKQGLKPAQILSLSFTRKAALELKSRLVQKFLQEPENQDLPKELQRKFLSEIQQGPIGTLHEFCFQLLKKLKPQGFELQLIEEASDQALQNQIKKNFLKEKLSSPQDHPIKALAELYDKKQLPALVQEAMKADFNTKPPADAEMPSLLAEESQALELVQSCAQIIQKSLKQEKDQGAYLSFDDLEIQALDLLQKSSPAVKKWAGTFRYLLVDEFQDTSPRQIAILESLQSLSSAQSPAYFFLVGDSKQSIYRFRQVDQDLLQKSQAKILKKGGLKTSLFYNWRSQAKPLKLINAFASQAWKTEKLSSIPPERRSEPAGLAQIVQLKNPQQNTVANIESARDHQVAWLVKKIKDLKKSGQALEEIALLYRSSGMVEKLKQAFEAAQIPYEVQGGTNLLKQAIFLDLKKFLKFLNQAQDDLNLIGLLRSPFFLLSDHSLYQIRQAMKSDAEISLWDFLKQWRHQPKILENFLESQKLNWSIQVLQKYLKQKNTHSPTLLLKNLSQELSLSAFYQELYRPAEALNLEQVLHWLAKLEAEDPKRNLADLIALLETEKKVPFLSPLSQVLSQKNSVKLMTFHAAKGLEFEVVFIVDLARKAPPESPLLKTENQAMALKIKEGAKLKASPRYEYLQALSKSASLEEDKRLLYVALSRAKHQLYVLLNPEIAKKKSSGLEKLFLESLGNLAEDFIKEEKIEVLEAEKKAPKKPAEILAETPSLSFTKNASSTVSELETYALCPLKHHYRYFLEVPEDLQSSQDPLNSTQKGSLLHESLNKLHQRPLSLAKDLIHEELQNFPEATKRQFQEDLENKLKTYLQSEAYQNIADAKEVLSEFPFVLALKTGSIRGQIDRLLFKQGQWLLVDFKFTEKHSGLQEIKKAYDFQLKSYLLAAQKALQASVKVEVHLLAQAKAIKINYSEKELKAHQALLEKIQKEKLKHRDLDQVDFRSHCYECAYGKNLNLCPTGKKLFKTTESKSALPSF